MARPGPAASGYHTTRAGAPASTIHARCVARRARVAGAYQFRIVGVQVDDTFVLLDGSDELRLLHREAADLCTSPLIDAWEPAQRRPLQSPSFFENCLAGDAATQNECLHGARAA